MKKSIFNPKEQNKDTSAKIVAGLERISEVFKLLLWEKAKAIGLSPIQIQILIFIAYHDAHLCTVSHLSNEFNVTKPTISDAVKVLLKKGIVEKDFSPSDNRSYTIILTTSGKKVVSLTKDFSEPLKQQFDSLESSVLENFFDTIVTVIDKLNKKDILSVQRMCYSCKYYEKTDSKHYCKLLEQTLLTKDIRLDCPEYLKKVI